ncbi:hypothetical protein FQR65_LT09315 [Abscondita terminalis]|nr:hypothetical protein FQR65_LT09315 [Abscondita terminalis]
MIRIQLLVVISSITIFAADPPGGFYQSKYDSLDVDNVLNNKRLVNYYANCLLSRGPCPPQGADLKRILPEALETNCLRCTPKQKTIAIETIKRLRDEYPIVYSELVSVYDPNGEYFIRFVKTLDPTIEIEDQSNLLSNRFGDDDFPNNLDSSTNKPTKKPTSTKRVTTKRPTTARPSTARPTTRAPITTTRSTEPAMTRTEEPLLNIFTTLPDISVTNRSAINTTSTSTPLNITSTTTAKSAITQDQQTYLFGWRPTVLTRPQITRPPHPLVQGNANLLSSIGEIGSRVFQAGTQVAEMVLSSVQALVGVVFSFPQSKYTNKYDNVNVDTILQNERVLNNYIKCLMEEGPCTAEGRELRRTLPDALSSGCSKCNDKQKEVAEKIIKHLISKRKRDWDRLAKKYDPKGDYKKRYETHIKSTPKP